jgi:hypothetical protein
VATKLGAAGVLVILAPRQQQLDAVGVMHQMVEDEPGDLARPQCGGKADQQQGPVAPPGKGVGDRLKRRTQPVEYQRGLLADRPAVCPLDAGEGRRDHGRRGRRRVAGEQVQVADRRVPQAQRVDREFVVRVGREKRGDGLGRGRPCGLCLGRAPSRRTGRRPRGRRSACFRPATPAVLRGGVGRVIKAGDRCRQFDDGLEIEPVGDVIGRAPGIPRRVNILRACAAGSGDNGDDGRMPKFPD